ncbi:MAG: hypothetical protein RMM28_07830 [Thermoleophilia bacterium]|nr:hypothetical protein [Thermoleophilia bacterium]
MRGCNKKLDDRFEQPTKGLIEHLMNGRVRLDAEATRTFAIWALKTWLILAHPDLQYSDPTLQARSRQWDLTGLPDLYRWMTSGDPPPEGLHLWLSRIDPDRDLESCPALFPAPARASGSTWSFLAAGHLAFDLVFDPTGTVEHPLESRGEALRLWPLARGQSLDLEALPYASLDVRWLPIPVTSDLRLLQSRLCR